MNQLIAGTIFLAVLLVIFYEKLNRTVAAMVGAMAMVAAGLLFNFYHEEQAIEAIDFPTLGLLLGMMLLVALLKPTGFFEYLAITVGRLSKGRPLRLMVLLGTVTTILSMFLDNVTTVVLIAPVTILICEILGMNPTPLLISEALLSNTGGTGTLVGDPPNVIIGSSAGLSFGDFLTHALPVVVVSWAVALGVLAYLFRDEWRTIPAGAQAISKLSPRKALNDPKAAIKLLIILFVAIFLFFIHHTLHLTPAFIALGAATTAFVLLRPDVEKTLANIEWNVLIFFSALFVMVGGLEHSGMLATLADLLSQFKTVNPVWLGIALIWIVAFLSAIIDNIPITIAFIPVIKQLGAEGIDIHLLWWALVFGAGFGGNGTIIGSTANVVVVSLSEKTRSPITAAIWSRSGLPVTVAVCLVATILYFLTYR